MKITYYSLPGMEDVIGKPVNFNDEVIGTVTKYNNKNGTFEAEISDEAYQKILSINNGFIGISSRKAENPIDTCITSTDNYILRKHTLSGKINFDIEQKNLIYSDCSPTHHGLQCNFVGGTPEHEKIMELCDQLVDIIKKIDTLNGERPEKNI